MVKLEMKKLTISLLCALPSKIYAFRGLIAIAFQAHILVGKRPELGRGAAVLLARPWGTWTDTDSVDSLEREPS